MKTSVSGFQHYEASDIQIKVSHPSSIRAQSEQPCINYHKLVDYSLSKQRLGDSFPVRWVARLALKPIKFPLRSTQAFIAWSTKQKLLIRKMRCQKLLLILELFYESTYCSAVVFHKIVTGCTTLLVEFTLFLFYKLTMFSSVFHEICCCCTL